MITPIALVVGFTSFVTFVCAVPQPSPSAQPSRVLSVPPLVPTGGPNVALFNLPATITPPTGETLNSVYIGYGIPLTLSTNLRNPKLLLQPIHPDVLHQRHRRSKTLRRYKFIHGINRTNNLSPPRLPDRRHKPLLRPESASPIDCDPAIRVDLRRSILRRNKERNSRQRSSIVFGCGGVVAECAGVVG
jgi:hypothetical protein